MRVLLLLAAFHAVFAAPKPEEQCPNGWTYLPKPGKCYKVIPEKVTWESGLKVCQCYGATLPSIHHVDEDKALGDFATGKLAGDTFHIGIRRILATSPNDLGHWEWTDGSVDNYSSFIGFGFQPSERYCGAAYPYGDSRWLASNCNVAKRSTMCQLPAGVANVRVDSDCSVQRVFKLLCPEEWTFVDGGARCYKALVTPISWKQSDASCKELNGSLVIIPDQHTDDIILEFAKAHPIGGYHIGLKDIRDVPVAGQSSHIEATWVDGSPMGYSNWKGGRPRLTQVPGTDGPCGGAFVEGQEYGLSRWIGSDCDRVKRAAICERSLLLSSPEKEANGGGHEQGGRGTKIDVEVKDDADVVKECVDKTSRCQAVGTALCDNSPYARIMATHCRKTCNLC